MADGSALHTQTFASFGKGVLDAGAPHARTIDREIQAIVARRCDEHRGSEPVALKTRRPLLRRGRRSATA